MTLKIHRNKLRRFSKFTSVVFCLVPLLLPHKVSAQLAPADDFFDGGAQLYISNNIPAALEKTEQGLKFYPNDQKLQKLEKLLKQQQQSQSQSQQNQQQKQNQQKNQQNKQQQSQNQKRQNSGEKQKQQEDSQQQKQKEQSEKQKQEQQANQNREKSEKQNGRKQKVAPGQMTPEEAKRLLDSQKDNEQMLTLKPPQKPQQENRPVKDW